MKFKENILKSHHRCLEYGLNINNKIINNTYSNIEVILKNNKELLLAASRIISLVYELIKNENLVIVLTDSNGLILNISGKYNMLKLKVGNITDEKTIGTTAISIAILEKKPLFINKDNHYIKELQNIDSYAAPIMINDKLIGLLGVFGNSNIDMLNILVKASSIISKDYENYKEKMDLKKIKSSLDRIENEFKSESEIISLEELEKNHIIKILDLNNGNITISAQSLGIARNTLYRKIGKYNIEISITE